MGLFDFLKVSVKKKPPAGARKPGAGANVVEFDGKSFPLAAITTKGLVISQFDGSLITGQNARITVRLDDQFAKLSFATTISVNEVKDGKMVGGWTMLDPQIETMIRKYGQMKKQKAGG